MELIAQQQISRRFTKALATYDQHALAQQHICRRLMGMLQSRGRLTFGRALEIGCGSGGFTRLLTQHTHVGQWVINDLCSQSRQFLPASASAHGAAPLFLAGDAEQIAFPGPFDLIASASAFQWMKKPDSFLKKLSALMQPKGVLLFNSFTPDNLSEIRRITGKGLHYPDAAQLRSWIEEAGLSLLHEEQETLTLTFDSPLQVLRHLKYTGVTATAGDTVWTRQKQADFCQRYRQLCGNARQQVTLTYSPIYCVAVKNRQTKQ